MRQIRWTTGASDQFVAAIERIQEDNASVAQSVAQAVIAALTNWQPFAGIGRPGEIKGSRELVCPPYVVMYPYTDDVVEILYVWHRAQDWK